MNMLSTTMTDNIASHARGFRDDDARWEAVCRRDPTADSAFFYSVRTTGVYCRPSCAARLPRRENVGFHETRADAERAGFRPCKRCRPDGPTATVSQTGGRTGETRSGALCIERIAALDWARLFEELDVHGC